jgi:hypothetical protein
MPTVYVITCEETEGCCGPGHNFTPEVFSDKALLDKRFEHLVANRRPFSEMFYCVSLVELNAENPDY